MEGGGGGGSNDTSSSSSSPNAQGWMEEQQQQQQQPSISYRVSVALTDEDACSCLVILLTFCFFASMTVILGFYGSVDLLVGPNCSRLLQVNSFFVQDIKVEAKAGAEGRAVLYGFFNPPPLDIETTWSETHDASIPPNFHEEWVYYLNRGAQVDVSYTVKSQGSNPLTLIIAKGKESFIQWIEDPFNPNSTLSWNLIHGNGMIQQNIVKPSDYYVAVANLNNLEMEVHLSFKIQTLLYNTTDAYYKCSLDHRLCSLKLFFLRANVGILKSSNPQKARGSDIDESYVKLSYGPRWITYFAGSGVMTLLILLAFKIVSYLKFCSGDPGGHQGADERTTPLVPNKDDADDSSLGSSYDSVSHEEEEDIEGWPAASRMMRDSGVDNPHRLCAICCDAQRDCFFLPCGHCVTCFSCGTRITCEAAGTCPICRRKTKKVRKIFTV